MTTTIQSAGPFTESGGSVELYQAADRLGWRPDGVMGRTHIQVAIGGLATLDMSTAPTAGDVIVIGSDTYEFLAAAGSVSNDAYIAVLRTGVAADDLDALIAAINATDADNAHDSLTKTDTVTPALANGTENVVASKSSTTLQLRRADEPGGTVTPGLVSLALDASGLTPSVDFSVADLADGGGVATVLGRGPSGSWAVLEHSLIDGDVAVIDGPWPRLRVDFDGGDGAAAVYVVAYMEGW